MTRNPSMMTKLEKICFSVAFAMLLLVLAGRVHASDNGQWGDAKMKWNQGNPTGHGIIFLRVGTTQVYCYVAPGGV